MADSSWGGTTIIKTLGAREREGGDYNSKGGCDNEINAGNDQRWGE